MDVFSGEIEASRLLASAAAGGLVFARTFGVCATAPLLAGTGLDWRFRIVLALALAGIVGPSAAPGMAALPADQALVWVVVSEALVGALLGMSAGLIIAGARQAGEVVSAQAGLSAASLFDPEADLELTALGHLYGLIALAVFLSMDGPLALVSALAESYKTVPVLRWELDAEGLARTYSLVGDSLALALRVAAPPAIALAVAGVAMGWLGRLAPAFPVLALSLPVRAAIGLMLVVLSLGTLVATLSQAWRSWPPAF